tara:strand:- start:134 stop:334 length:201 start_codon:yes stop_codon:yes gene_type:complete
VRNFLLHLKHRVDSLIVASLDSETQTLSFETELSVNIFEHFEQYSLVDEAKNPHLPLHSIFYQIFF